MNILKRIFFRKGDPEKVSLEWNERLIRIYDSIKNDELNYPIILFSHVLWDFDVYNNPIKIIGESIIGHWGLFAETCDPKEIVFDSEGKVFKLNKEHYDDKTKTRYSYPSILIGNEDLDSLKRRIYNGCEDYILKSQENEEIIRAKMKIVNEIDSIPKLIFFVEKEMNLTERKQNANNDLS